MPRTLGRQRFRLSWRRGLKGGSGQDNSDTRVYAAHDDVPETQSPANRRTRRCHQYRRMSDAKANPCCRARIDGPADAAASHHRPDPGGFQHHEPAGSVADASTEITGVLTIFLSGRRYPLGRGRHWHHEQYHDCLQSPSAMRDRLAGRVGAHATTSRCSFVESLLVSSPGRGRHSAGIGTPSFKWPTDERAGAADAHHRSIEVIPAAGAPRGDRLVLFGIHPAFAPRGSTRSRRCATSSAVSFRIWISQEPQVIRQNHTGTG